MKTTDNLDETQRRMRREQLERLGASLAAEIELQGKSDAEVADLVEEHLWMFEDLTSIKSALLSSAIDRLRRSGAGKLLTAEPKTQRVAPVGGFIGKCPRCSRVPEIHIAEGEPIGHCAQCWLGEGVHVAFVEKV